MTEIGRIDGIVKLFVSKNTNIAPTLRIAAFFIKLVICKKKLFDEEINLFVYCRFVFNWL
jgi:hypothetical protein